MEELIKLLAAMKVEDLQALLTANEKAAAENVIGPEFPEYLRAFRIKLQEVLQNIRKESVDAQPGKEFGNAGDPEAITPMAILALPGDHLYDKVFLDKLDLISEVYRFYKYAADNEPGSSIIHVNVNVPDSFGESLAQIYAESDNLFRIKAAVLTIGKLKNLIFKLKNSLENKNELQLTIKQLIDDLNDFFACFEKLPESIKSDRFNPRTILSKFLPADPFLYDTIFVEKIGLLQTIAEENQQIAIDMLLRAISHKTSEFDKDFAKYYEEFIEPIINSLNANNLDDVINSFKKFGEQIKSDFPTKDPEEVLKKIQAFNTRPIPDMTTYKELVLAIANLQGNAAKLDAHKEALDLFKLGIGSFAALLGGDRVLNSINDSPINSEKVKIIEEKIIAKTKSYAVIAESTKEYHQSLRDSIIDQLRHNDAAQNAKSREPSQELTQLLPNIDLAAEAVQALRAPQADENISPLQARIRLLAQGDAKLNLTIQKYEVMNKIVNTNNDPKRTPKEKVENFKKTFIANKEILNKDPDPIYLRFFKAIRHFFAGETAQELLAKDLNKASIGLFRKKHKVDAILHHRPNLRRQ